jgi:hypothetical protein
MFEMLLKGGVQNDRGQPTGDEGITVPAMRE